MSNELAHPNETDLANPMSPLSQVMKDGGVDWIQNVRLKSSGSHGLAGEAGDWVFNKDKPLGDKMKAYIGPWRLAARRFKSSDMDLQAFNRTAGSSFSFNEEAGTFTQSYPDFSLDFAEIFHKKIPDDGMNCSNQNGIDVLLYLPDIGEWAVYFIAKKAKTATNVASEVSRYYNRCMSFGSKRGPGKYNYHIPTVALLTDQVVWPVDFEEKFKKFLETPIEATEEATER